MKVRKLGQAPPSPSAYPRIHVGKSKYRKIAHSAPPPRVLDEGGGGGGGLSSQVKSTSAAPVRAPHSPFSLFLLSVFPNLRSVGPRRGEEGGVDPPLRFSVRSLRSQSGSAPGRRSEERREKGGIRQLAPIFPSLMPHRLVSSPAGVNPALVIISSPLSGLPPLPLFSARSWEEENHVSGRLLLLLLLRPG